MDGITLYMGTITFLCLGWASYADLKHRLVPDKIWVVQLLLTTPALVFWFLQNQEFIPRLIVVINIILGILMGFGLVYLGAMGGGDGKAIMVISISFPFYSLDPNFTIFMPPIFFIMVNMLIFVLTFAFSLLIMNLISITKFGSLFSETQGTLIQKMSILISGRRLDKSSIEHLEHEDPAEILEDEWKLYTPIFSEVMTDEEYEEMESEAREIAWKNIRDTDRTHLWTRPQPPGLLFLLFAHLLWFTFGSPFLILFS